jgi:hypothetical protein
VERPTRAKKNFRPAQVILDNTIHRRSAEQKKADDAKAKADAAAAESAMAIQKKSQLERCATLQDALQTRDNARSLEALRPDLFLNPKSAANTDVETLSDSRPMDDEPADTLSKIPPAAGRSSSTSEEFLSGWQEEEHDVAPPVEEQIFKEQGEEEEGDEDLTDSETEAASDRVPKKRGKRREKEERGKFRAAVNSARQVPPPPPPHSKKRKVPNPPPDEDNTSTKRSKPTAPAGLVYNWKKNAGLHHEIALKNPIEFVDSDEAIGKFDKPEGSEMLSAVRASKKSQTSLVDVVHKFVGEHVNSERHTHNCCT